MAKTLRPSRSTLPSQRTAQDWRPNGAEQAFSWFPGHMRKAQLRLAEELKQSDLVLELRDARIPVRSANPELATIVGQRPRLVVLNKASLADPAATVAWSTRFDAEGLVHLFVDADSRQGLATLLTRIAELTQRGQDHLRSRGIRPPPPRVVIVGLPNVGKSTLINRLAKRQRAKTAPMPGVTRHMTWIQVEDKFQLMDSPGIMLPRIANESDALALTWIGAIRDSILGAERVTQTFLEYLLAHPTDIPAHSWWPADWTTRSAMDVMEHVARQRGFLSHGGGVNISKTAQFLLDEYRAGHLGRMTFDAPERAGSPAS